MRHGRCNRRREYCEIELYCKPLETLYSGLETAHAYMRLGWMDHNKWGAALFYFVIPFILCTFNCAFASPLCSREKASRSIEASTATAITFINKTLRPIRIYWLDYEGSRKFYAAVEAGESHFQKTYLTHPWIASSENGECLGLYMPQTNASFVAIADKAANHEMPDPTIQSQKSTDRLTLPIDCDRLAGSNS